MLTFIVVLTVLSVLFGVGFFITGVLFTAFVWVFIKLPVGLIALALGLVMCCTIILIPLGIGLFKTGFKLIIPGI